MRFSITFLILIIYTANWSIAQQWEQKSFDFDGHNRTYKTYCKSSTSTNMSVVFMFHGLGGSKNDIDFTNWKAIADTANILLVSPEALPYTVTGLGSLGPAWNSGITLEGTLIGDITLNPDIDDVGFILALLDTVKSNFNIDGEHVFIGGFSNGGFFTQRLLCEVPQYFRVAASNAGTKALTLDSCNDAKLPIAHFHGTDDSVVTWEGIFKSGLFSAPAGLSVDSLITYWTERNNVIPDADTTIIGNSNSNFFITKYSYNQGADSNFKEVALYKVHNTGHFWHNYNTTNNEFDIAVETWRFYAKHSSFKPNNINVLNNNNNIKIYPNPSSSIVNIDIAQHFQIVNINIIDGLGRTVRQQDFSPIISISDLHRGIYILQLWDKSGKRFDAKIVKE